MIRLDPKSALLNLLNMLGVKSAIRTNTSFIEFTFVGTGLVLRSHLNGVVVDTRVQ